MEVAYYLSGSATSADITMETPDGTSQQSVGVPLKNQSGGTGLRFTFEKGAFVYLSAQNNGDGTIICRIIGSDGEVISEVSSSGRSAIASCDGQAA